MSQVVDQPSPNTPTDADLVSAIQRILASSAEPLTLSKLRSQLPPGHRQTSPEELAEVLRRQVAASTLHQYPPYRSQQDRYWDRSMPVHVANLVLGALEESPQTVSQLRRKLPAYALAHAGAALEDQLNQGRVHRHPRGETRGGERFGSRPPDPKEYVAPELSDVFHRLEELGFARGQVRGAALELLHDEEWAPAPRASVQAADTAEVPEEERTAAGEPAMTPPAESGPAVP